MTSIFIDSWGWITLASSQESHHKIVSDYYRKISQEARIVTSDYILDEVTTFLFSRIPAQTEKYLQGLWESIKQHRIQLESISRTRFEAAWKMRMKYKDHSSISFTDFTSFTLMKELKIREVLTNDHHFEKLNLGFSKTPTILFQK